MHGIAHAREGALEVAHPVTIFSPLLRVLKFVALTFKCCQAVVVGNVTVRLGSSLLAKAGDGTAMIEHLRANVIEGLHGLAKVKPSWPVWMSTIRSVVSDPMNPDDILGIADRLKQIFNETKAAPSRSAAEEQSAASTGGSAWEALVCWYLNLCLIGSSAVVVKRPSQLKGPITDAITARYNNERVNSEADLLAVTFPDAPPFVEGPGVDMGWNLKSANVALSTGGLEKSSIAVIQCKTNWKDNAQIPMLWDLIYQTGAQLGGRVTIGINHRAPQHFASFKYAFVTVPSGDDVFERHHVPVLRVNALSGGNYWGQKSKDGVAMSLSEIFPKARIGPDGGKGIRGSLLLALPQLRTRYAYFGL
jgi:hypothetical protein